MKIKGIESVLVQTIFMIFFTESPLKEPPLLVKGTFRDHRVTSAPQFSSNPRCLHVYIRIVCVNLNLKEFFASAPPPPPPPPPGQLQFGFDFQYLKTITGDFFQTDLHSQPS